MNFNRDAQKSNKKAQRFAQRLFISAAFVASLIGGWQQTAMAGNNDKLVKDTDRLVSAVQNNLTMQGKWPPPAGSSEMQLCSALQLFVQEVKRGNGQNIQGSAFTVDSLISSVGAPDVMTRWINIKNQIGLNTGFNSGFNNGYNPGFNSNFNSGFNPEFNRGFNPGANSGFNSGFNPNFNSGFNPGFNSGFSPSFNSGFNPNFNPNLNSNFNRNFNGNNNGGSSDVSGSVRDLNDSLKDFISFSQKSMGSGGFTSGNSNAIFAMANALQMLQMTVKSSGNSLARANNFSQQQMQLQQIVAAFTHFEPLLLQAGPSAQNSMRYSQVKNQLSILQNAVYMNAGRMR